MTMCQFLFCRHLPVWYNSFPPKWLGCSFLIPFTKNLITFSLSIFDFLLLLIVKLGHMISRLLYLSAQCSCSVRFGSRALYLKYLTFSFCSRLFIDAICNYWTVILQITMSWLKISMVEKLISKELVNPFGLYDNSLLMGHHPTWLFCQG